ncbi:cache domain-containing protein [Leucobacter sp. W1038]|uniref:cache domain-containing protein n=1 Tax=Leucobacter sp. W1038 TaxID=3438281 RepID=UPI003D981BC2
MNANPVPGLTQQTLETVVETLARWFDDRFVSLQGLATRLTELLRFDESGLLDLSETSRRKLKGIAAHHLADNLVVDGCGLIFAHSALGTPNGHLEWWVREDETRFARYSFGVVPGADRYYDYEQHEWFIRAYSEGIPALVGPYIDYLGVEAYVLTLTVPADVQGKRVGAVGNDIQAEDLEAELLPTLLSCADELVLVGRHDNVLLSNTSLFLPGEHVTDVSLKFRRIQLMPGSRDVQLLVPLGESR